MNILLAHHLMPQHVPVLATMFGVGIWIGWQMVSRFTRRTR